MKPPVITGVPDSSHLLSFWRILDDQGETGKRFDDLLCVSRAKEQQPMEAAHSMSLEARHAGLDRRLEEERRRPAPNTAVIADLKKKKLKLRDTLALH
jgi:hypothetical protein